MVEYPDSEVQIGDQRMSLRLAQPHELSKLKQLDDDAFGPHHGISQEELEAIQTDGVGYILGIYDEKGELAGDAQVVEKKVEPLEIYYDFTGPEEIYLYGIAVSPKYWENGIGKILIREYETLSHSRGARKVTMTIRVENGSNLHLMLGMGHRITHYWPYHYGEDLYKDSRFLVQKELTPDNLGLYQSNNPEQAVHIPVAFGDSVDLEAHHCCRELLDQGYQGVCTDRKGIYFTR